MEGKRTNENINEVRDINILFLSERSHEKVFFVNTLVNCLANRSPREAKRKRPLVYMVPCEFNVTDKHDRNHKITIKPNADDYHKVNSRGPLDIETLVISVENRRISLKMVSYEGLGSPSDNMNIEKILYHIGQFEYLHAIFFVVNPMNDSWNPRLHEYWIERLTHSLHSSVAENFIFTYSEISKRDISKAKALSKVKRIIKKKSLNVKPKGEKKIFFFYDYTFRYLAACAHKVKTDESKYWRNSINSFNETNSESQLEKNADPLIIQEWKKVLSKYLALHEVNLLFDKDGSFVQDEMSKLSRLNNFGNTLMQMYRCQTVPRTNEFITTHSGHAYLDLKRVDTGIINMTNRELIDNNKENFEYLDLAEQIGSYNIISSNNANGSILENSVDIVSVIRNKLEATTLNDSNTDLSSIDSYSQNNDAKSFDVYSQQSGGRDPRNRSSGDNPSTPGKNSSIFLQSTLQHSNQCTSNPSVLKATSYLNKRFLAEFRHSNDNLIYNNGQAIPSSLPNSSLDSDYSTCDNQSSDHSNTVDVYSLPFVNIHSPSNYSYTTKPPSNYAQEPLNQKENIMYASDIQSNNIENPLYQQEHFGVNAQQMFSYDHTRRGNPSPHSSSRDGRRPNMEHIVFHQSYPAGENIQQSSSNKTEFFMPIYSTWPHVTQVAQNELQQLSPPSYDHSILIGSHHPLPFKYMEQEGLHHQPSPTGKNVQERSSNPPQYLQPVPDTQGNRPPSVVRVTNQRSRKVRKKVHKPSSTAQISDTKSDESKYQNNKKGMPGTTFDNTQSLVTKQNSLSTNVDQNTQTEYFYPKKVSDPMFYEGTPIFMQESNSRIPHQNIQSISQRTSSDSSTSLSLVEPLYIDIQEDCFLLDAEHQNLPNALMPAVQNIHQINKK